MEPMQAWLQAAKAGLLMLAPRALAAVAIVLGGVVLARVLSRMAAAPLCAHPRGVTLAPLVRALIRVTVVVVALVVALDQLGVNVTAVIAGAGIVGLAVGFGAQSLVKDLISGFFVILEDSLRIGDVAQVGQVTGSVEAVGLRTTQVRTYNGQLFFIPNGSIAEVGNFNRGWCRAVVDVSVAYEAELAVAMRVLREVGEAFAKEQGPRVLETPEVVGAMGLNASDITLRLAVKVKPMEHWSIERQLRARVKAAFDEAGIEIPYPRRVMIQRQEAAR